MVLKVNENFAYGKFHLGQKTIKNFQMKISSCKNPHRGGTDIKRGAI